MIDFDQLFKEAEQNAKDAAGKAYTCFGGDRGACGFAWVHIPDGRSRLVRELKKRGIGSRHWKSGWMIWNPSKAAVQSVDILAVGAGAYADTLRKAGFKAYCGSRLD